MSRGVARFAIRKRPAAIDRTVRGLVRDAYRNVPRFRRRLDSASVRPIDVRTAQDLARIPLDGHAAILDAPRRDSLRRGTRVSSCRKVETSGTTGEPVTIYMSPAEAFYRRILLFRALRRSVRLSFPLTMAEVGAGLIRIGVHRGDVTQRVGLVRVTKIARTLSGEEQARLLLEAAPQVVIGPPSCLELVAESLSIGDERISGWPRLVIARGEVMRRGTRELLRRTFPCPVVDFYNCEEVGNVAWECPDGAGVMHVNTDGCIVEIADDDGRPVGYDEEGNVVITNLFNRTMPFIRYQLGDRAALLAARRCGCGYEGPSLSLLAGRAGDFVTLSSGERVSPRAVDSLIAKAVRRDDDTDLFDLRMYQVQQNPAGGLRVLVVPRRTQPPDLGERIRGALRRLDSGLKVSIEQVSEIRPEVSGKLKVVRRDPPPADEEAGAPGGG